MAMAHSLLPDKYTEGLNPEQKEAFEVLTQFLIAPGGGMRTLKGYAGTGKTFTCGRIIQWFTDHMKQGKKKWDMPKFICMTAPTNKAVAVLKDSSDPTLRKNGYVIFQTIHKLLGVRQVITEDGREEFKAEKEPEIDGVALVIIDEVSMLADDLFHKLLPYVEDKSLKIIFMGDPAQIPPVGKIDCEPFLRPEIYGIEEIHLKQIMRQADGSKLVEVSFEIRENLGGWNKAALEDKNGFDLKILHNNTGVRKAMIRDGMQKFFSSDTFRSDPGNYKCVAWRNARIKFFNEFIRSAYHGIDSSKLPEYVKGDMLVMNKPVTEGRMILLHTNQEVKVIDISDDVFTVEDTKLFGFRAMVEYYDVDAEDMVKQEIKLISAEAKPRLEKILETIANSAKHSTTPHKKKYHWKRFFETRDYFADVYYAFALTAHKSQGSTYKMVWVDMNDIGQNPNVVERNRIAYTAITRAKEMCNIITT